MAKYAIYAEQYNEEEKLLCVENFKTHKDLRARLTDEASKEAAHHFFAMREGTDDPDTDIKRIWALRVKKPVGNSYDGATVWDVEDQNKKHYLGVYDTPLRFEERIEDYA